MLKIEERALDDATNTIQTKSEMLYSAQPHNHT